MTDPQSQPQLLNDRAAAAILGCSPGTVRNLRNSGQLRSVRLGRLIRIELSEIQQFIAERRMAGGPQR